MNSSTTPRRGLQSVLEGLERRQAVRAPTGLDFACSDRIDALNESAWSALTSSHWMMSRAYLSAVESARLPNVQHRYALAFQQGRPMLAMSMQIVEVSVDRLHAAEKPFVPALDSTRLEEGLRQRVLVCGNMLSSGCDGIAFAEDLEPSLGFRAVAEALYRVRWAEKLYGHTNVVLLKDFTNELIERSRTLEDLSYRVLSAGPTMVLQLDPSWRKHDDYLAAMTSKYRSSVRRQILAPIEGAGCRVVRLTAQDVELNAGRLQELYLAVQDSAAVRPITVSEGYWTAQARLQRCFFNAIVRNDEVLGFLAVQVDGSCAHAAQIGFDREAAHALPLYLRLLHTAVETGLEQTCTQVDLGRTALEPKARMGAKAQETFMWVRHRVPLVNALTKGLLDFVKHEPAPEIDPFKRAPAMGVV